MAQQFFYFFRRKLQIRNSLGIITPLFQITFTSIWTLMKHILVQLDEKNSITSISVGMHASFNEPVFSWRFSTGLLLFQCCLGYLRVKNRTCNTCMSILYILGISLVKFRISGYSRPWANRRLCQRGFEDDSQLLFREGQS